MKKLLLAAATAALTAPAAPLLAQDSPHTLTANVGLFSEYIFRGVTQTAGDPAVQGGFDYGHSSGFYVGTWASNVSWLTDFGTYSSSSLEWDFYGGFKKNFGSSDFYWDVGTIYYYYPGNRVAYPTAISDLLPVVSTMAPVLFDSAMRIVPRMRACRFSSVASGARCRNCGERVASSDSNTESIAISS